MLLALGLAPAYSHGVMPSINAGYEHSIALKADGTVRTWGSDSSGQLASGRPLAYPTPGLVPGLSGVRAVDAGCNFSLALKNDGTVWSWGGNDQGQLGDGSTSNRSTPGPVPGLSDVSAISAGCLHALALKNDGTVWAWGYGQDGQIGDANTVNRPRPVRVPGLTDVVSIGGGSDHSVAMTRDGTVWRWGRSISNNTTFAEQLASWSPARLAGVTDVVAVASGYNTIALKRDGTLVGLGPNQYGELGDGTTTRRSTPVPVAPALQVTAISEGAFSSIAIKPDRTLMAWGRNAWGQLGDATFTDRLTPVAVPGITGVTSLSAGAFHSTAITSDGSAWAWGYNYYGQLGDGSRASRSTPRRVTGIANVTAVAAGSEHTVALTSDGNVWAWGGNRNGELGLDVAVFGTTPIAVPGLEGVAAVGSGFNFSFAVKTDGRVLAWGENGYGQLGDGTNTPRSLPTPMSGISNVAAITGGASFTLALKRDGTVWAWGDNWAGQLGNGTRNGSGFPAQVSGLSDVIAIAAGPSSSLALKRDGTVWGWGLNDYGQLGSVGIPECNPAFPQRCTLSPTQVPGLTGVVGISLSANIGLVVKGDGTVWGFGLSSDGALGEFANPSATPRQVPGLSDVVAVAAGERYSLALKRDGTVWALGFNYWGQLGDGTGQRSGTPVQAKGLTGIVAISARSKHSMALKADGTVYTWGRNEYGALGDGTLAWRFTPVVTHREGGAGSLVANDWFLDLDPATPDTIPADKVPVFLVTASGTAASAVAGVTANIQFRAQDVGKPIYVFAYAPSGLVKRDRETKDGEGCVLSQLGPDGVLTQVTASSVQSFVGNVTSSQAQAVSVLNNVSAAQLAGTTFCVGSAATAAQSVDPANNQCVVTVPADRVCVAPGRILPLANAPGPLSGMWWNSGESGWGIHFTQRRDVVFAAWYTYDTNGNPKWYVASNCTMPGAGVTSGTCSGALFEVSGPTFFSGAFNPMAVRVTVAGSLQVSFQSASAASMTYTAGGLTRTVPITRQVFQTGGSAPAVDYTDLWWNAAESGWGLAVTQQYSMIFLAWYVYDSVGRPVWYVVPNCPLNATGNACFGDIYRTTGPAFGPAFNPAQVQPFAVGRASMDFTDPSNAVLTYTVDGVTSYKLVTRQLF